MIKNLLKSFRIKNNSKATLLNAQRNITKEISIIWCLEDIQDVRPDLTDEQASDVLKYLEKNHNAEIGINWEMIEIVSDMLYPA